MELRMVLETKAVMTSASPTMVRPMRAYMMVCLACLTLPGSPAEVM